MTTLVRYILKTFLLKAFLIACVLIGIFIVFDVLANSEKITAGKAEFIESIFTYIMLRLPGIAMFILPLATLLAAIFTLIQFVTRQELVTMHAAGMSIYHIILILLAGGVAISILHFALGDRILADTAYKLRIWAESDYGTKTEKNAVLKPLPSWIVSGNTLVYIKDASANGKEIFGIILIKRDENGKATTYYTAQQASFEEGKGIWKFKNVYQNNLNGEQEIFYESIRMPIEILSEKFSISKKTSHEFTVAELLHLSNSNRIAEHPKFIYSLWIQKKFAQSFSILVMIMLATPIGFQLARRSQILLVGALIITAGFSYIFFENLLLTLGEANKIPSIMAAWLTPVFFSLAAVWVAFVYQK